MAALSSAPNVSLPLPSVLLQANDEPNASMKQPVSSFYGAEPIPLPSRFARIKRKLIAGHEDAVRASWARLLTHIRAEVAHIEQRGSGLIPDIDFASIDDPAKVEPFAADLKRYGVAVVRGVVKPSECDAWMRQTSDYLEANKDKDLKPPPPQDPACLDLFWTPAQVNARAHPNMLKAQQFAMNFWHANGDARLGTRFPITYVDRIRIHKRDQNGASITNGNSAAEPLANGIGDPCTVMAQVDSGSLERWEPDGYGRSGVYDAIFRGEWEQYDPWDGDSRASVTPDLYNGWGACSIFRMSQGLLALTPVEPKNIRVVPAPHLTTAYFLLRPFFKPRKGPPATTDEGELDEATSAEWDAFLDPSNWEMDSAIWDLDAKNAVIHGAVPGHAQRVTELWHPHLRLRRSLIGLPALRPGDYVIWHCDQPYAITSSTTTSAQPEPSAATDDTNGHVNRHTPAHDSVLMYIGACPLTQTNALFLARQRKAFLLGHPGPDFDSTGSGRASEGNFTSRPGKEDVSGSEGQRGMGLQPWDADTIARSKNEAEADMVRLANIILFPDRYDFYLRGNGNGNGNGGSGYHSGVATPRMPSSRLTAGIARPGQPQVQSPSSANGRSPVREATPIVVERKPAAPVAHPSSPEVKMEDDVPTEAKRDSAVIMETEETPTEIKMVDEDMDEEERDPPPAVVKDPIEAKLGTPPTVREITETADVVMEG